jgi:hypothetical protein
MTRRYIPSWPIVSDAAIRPQEAVAATTARGIGFTPERLNELLALVEVPEPPPILRTTRIVCREDLQDACRKVAHELGRGPFGRHVEVTVVSDAVLPPGHALFYDGYELVAIAAPEGGPPADDR